MNDQTCGAIRILHVYHQHPHGDEWLKYWECAIRAIKLPQSHKKKVRKLKPSVYNFTVAQWTTISFFRPIIGNHWFAIGELHQGPLASHLGCNLWFRFSSCFVASDGFVLWKFTSWYHCKPRMRRIGHVCTGCSRMCFAMAVFWNYDTQWHASSSRNCAMLYKSK